MEYSGKLYGKIGNRYVEMSETSSDIEKLRSELQTLKNEGKLEMMFKEFQEFAKNKFPKATFESTLIGLQREIKEVELARGDYYVIDTKEHRKALGLEYVDCFMYLLDSMNRVGFELKELNELFAEKLKINKEREWKQNVDGSYSHVK